jgi:hypothetical protein
MRVPSWLLFVALAWVSLAEAAEPRTLLAVFAHPDDESLIGPLLAKYGREGVRVQLVIVTEGEKACSLTQESPRDPNWPKCARRKHVAPARHWESMHPSCWGSRMPSLGVSAARHGNTWLRSSASFVPPNLESTAVVIWKGRAGGPLIVSNQRQTAAASQLRKRSLWYIAGGIAILCWILYELTKTS